MPKNKNISSKKNYAHVYLYQLLMVSALCVNYTCAYMLLFVWEEIIYYYIMVVAASLLAGFTIAQYVKSILYVTFSTVVGGIIAIAIVITPLIIYGGDYIQINVSVLVYTSFVGRLLLIGLPLSIFIVFMGCFLFEFVEDRVHLPK